MFTKYKASFTVPNFSQGNSQMSEMEAQNLQNIKCQNSCQACYWQTERF